MSLAQIRQGLAKNLSTIRGLRVAETIPDQVNPPVAIIELQTADYDGALRGGLTTYTFQVSVIVGRVSERTAQRTLDAYITPGVGSIKDAIESDRSLDGSADTVRVERMGNYGSVTIGDVTYMAADFTVTIYT
jgi:hypothetical protein